MLGSAVGQGAGAHVARVLWRFGQRCQRNPAQAELGLQQSARQTGKEEDHIPLVVPWTVQLNGEYIHQIGGVEVYGRGDFSYSSRIKKPVDVNSPLVDPTLPRPPSTSQLDLRFGGRFEVSSGNEFDLSFFVNNVTNSMPLVSLFHETPDSTFYRSGTFRPRTIGITLSVRN